MKKFKLFLAACAAMVGLSANADNAWVGASEITSGSKYYLYNVGSGLYLSAGNNWGTKAIAAKSAISDATITAVEGGYTIVFSYAGNGLFAETDAGSVYTDRGNQGHYVWNIVPTGNGNAYTIQLANTDEYYQEGKYLAPESSTSLSNITYLSEDTNLNKWLLIPASEIANLTNLESTVDLTMLVSGAECGYGTGYFNQWYSQATELSRLGYTTEGSYWKFQDNSTREGFTGCWIEAYNGSGLGDATSIKKTISNLPEGHYKLSVYAVGNGSTFYFGDQNNSTKATDNITKLSLESDLNATGSLEFGFIAASSIPWFAFDNVTLEYTSFKKNYTDKLSEAGSLATSLDGKIPTAALNALNSVIADQTGVTSGYMAAANALASAMATANNLVTPFARYTSIRDAVLAINSGIDVSTANSQANDATDAADIEAAVTTVRAALASYLSTVSLSSGETIDLTDALIDNAAPGVSGTTDYWTNSQTPTLQYQLWEYYNKSGATTKQTIAAQLPVGNYKLTAVAFTRSGYEAKLNAGDVSTNIATVSSNEVNDRNSGNTWIAAGNGVTDLVFNLASATSNLEIGLTADNANGDHWMCWRSFRLIYGDVFEPYTLAEGKMNKDVAAAQAQADATFKSTPSPETYMAVINAIAAAEASIKAYAPMTAAIDKIDAALTAATSATASTDTYSAVKATYTEATIADADILTQVAAAYDAVIPVIKSQTAANADFTLAIQNQSFEYGDMTGWTATASSDTGVRETSNATFAATGSDGFYLFNTWWQGVPLTQALEGLPTGEYTLTASVASDGATIYLLANGEHNDGIETYAETNVENSQFSKDTFQDAMFTFLVKDGNLTIGVVGGAGGDAGVHKDYVEEGYWWYKADNFRLVKNRDLTEEELAVIPTAIALYNGEVEVTEPIALDATDASVTLTPSFTPAYATPTVTWTSSDEAVATVVNGVVTAVSSGTAIIAVKSTLDENVSASATVTVSFPESEVVSYVNDGATRMVYNLGENLIKNGSFEYSDNFYGWTAGNGAKLTSSNFSIETSGAYDGNNYLKAKQDNGQTGAGSIYTSWPVEAGKKYVFSYQMKNSSAVSNDDYIRTSLSATTTEDATSYSETFKAVSCGTDWTTLSYEFTVPEGKNYLVFSARWLKSSKSFDNFYLCEVLSDPTTEGNVEYATAAIPTANIGTGAFQYSQAAINAANALVQGTATVVDVTNAYNALTTLNAPEDGKLYNIVNITDGFAHKGKALTFKSASDADLSGNTTSMAWEAEPGYYMPQGVKFTAVEGVKNGYKLSYTRADGNVVYISTGTLSGLGNNHNQIRPTNDATKALTFEVTSVGDNHWYLKNTETGNNVGSNGDTGFYTAGGSNKDMKIQEAVNNEVALNIKAENQYGTLILPFNAEFPAGVTAYSVSEVSGSTLTLVEANAFNANTPYIVYAEEDVTAPLAGLGSAYTDERYTEGLLTGVYAATPAPVGSYVLQKNNGKVGFYVVAEGKRPTVGANRAYVNRPADTVGVKAFYLGENDLPTAIQSVFDGLVDGDAYDLAGRKVQKLQKGGVYIINGKKVVVK